MNKVSQDRISVLQSVNMYIYSTEHHIWAFSFKRCGVLLNPVLKVFTLQHMHIKSHHLCTDGVLSSEDSNILKMQQEC